MALNLPLAFAPKGRVSARDILRGEWLHTAYLKNFSSLLGEDLYQVRLNTHN